MALREEALDYHARGRPGKLAIHITKPFATQRDLSLAYTPGVAEPVREIAHAPLEAYRYTAKGNLVGVVSNGTAVLGLGNVGALASKPVMEGKAVLFKRFADVDVFDVEVDTTDPEEFVRVVRAIAPTFGGINLEDIRAPDCFWIEQRLREELDIPVFHDDQHGTAIIAGAALLNALELVDKRIDAVRLVISGAGASAIACAEFFLLLGMRRDQIVLVDTKGVVYRGRTDGMNPYKERFAADTPARTLAEALAGADVFVGLSAPNIVTGEMLKTMADHPIVFALANPDPEIPYEEARAARPDAIVATGRSDYPNQVNNVLGFPFIFRGALDVRARAINEEMKLAACRALAALAKQEVPDSVLRAYGLEKLAFGPDYLIPKPLDPRVALWVAPAVAEAAMRSGVARRHVDLEVYREELARRLVRGREVMGVVFQKARRDPKRIVFSEGEEPKILRAAAIVAQEGIATPLLLGREAVVRARMEELRINGAIQVVDPDRFDGLEAYAQELYRLRQRKGVTLREARTLIRQPNYFGAMMVRRGDADGFVAGLTYHYPDVIRPALQVIGPGPGVSRVAGLYLMILDGRPYLFTDPTVNIDPTEEELAEIAIMAADKAREFDLEPRVAMISFSNFGSTRHPRSDKVARATELVKEARPDLMVDGEMMADVALSPELRAEDYPFSALVGEANVLVFPSLEAANVAYKLVQRLGGAVAVGPILMGMAKPVHVLSRGAEVSDVVNITAIAVVDAQTPRKPVGVRSLSGVRL
ncbi:MAG: NADP-dependent malic enzyme [Armatimonadota bacterium]|nr:NADP-dependent malic enzyme [Armatimonadota bacterium]MDR7393831.1 NADP-dependent malic enzyme [Armatimonadota bacterium]MDR7397284.1 NADP-dependent malic enzyme [Armatimonadota bacterium]MDR7400075.1 NADP-dependent malic enzyme [Armatimonadota bacterium]MDR7409333.1 NADP-dependent malic enzyme [Armatimonadota bacterium]